MQRTLKAITVCSLFLALSPGAWAGALVQEESADAATSGAEEATTEEASEASLSPRYRVVTSMGDIVLELDGEKAPITVQNFDQYVQDGFYEGTIFHRVMPDFMIQGGGYTAELEEKKEGMRAPIKNEWQNGLKNERGTISMARLGGNPDSATAQFFINVVDNPSLDRPQPDGAAYAVFGKVVEGMETVDKIRNTETVSHPRLPMGKVVPKETVTIEKVETLVPLDDEKISEASKAAEERASTAKREEVDLKRNAIARVVAEQEKKYGAEATFSETGLGSIVIKEGDGPKPSRTDRVSVHYTGMLTNGQKFDSSVDRGRPFEFSLTGGVIQGWLEGVADMQVGEKRLLIIPPELGYGAGGAGATIPPNATLLFEVELLSIK